MAIVRSIVLFIFLVLGNPLMAQTFTGIANWQYIPVNLDLGKSLEDAKANNVSNRLIKKSFQNREQEKGTSVEGEAEMILSLACIQKEMYFCAYYYAMDTLKKFPGSMPALWALEILEKIVRERPFIEKDLKRVINSGAFKEIQEPMLPMVNFYVALDNSEKKLFPWIEKAVKKIGENNYWSLRWKYLIALEDIRRKKADVGVTRLESLQEEAKKFPRIQELLNLQIARLKFEMADYTGSLSSYAQISATGRLAGRVLRERAWVYYAMGEYAETLGLLQALNAPQYAISSDPEQFLLEMLTYRKLCHFNETKKPAKIFTERYGEVIEHLRQRKPLSDNIRLAHLSFIKASFENEVETVSQIIEEREKLDSQSWPSLFKKELGEIYNKSSTEIRQEVEINLRKDLSLEATRLLQIADQIQLVDYLSSLDAFRIQKDFENRKYVASDLPFGDFRTLYWPVIEGEYWYDEFKNYKFLIKDQCSGLGSAK